MAFLMRNCRKFIISNNQFSYRGYFTGPLFGGFLFIKKKKHTQNAHSQLCLIKDTLPRNPVNQKQTVKKYSCPSYNRKSMSGPRNFQ